MTCYSTVAKEILLANSIKCLPGAKARKGPILKNWSKYTREKPTDKRFESWCSKFSDYNVCLPLGKLTNVICIDVDIDESKYPDKFREVIVLLPPTSIKKFGSKGISAFYRYDSEESMQFNLSNGEVAVEVLSTGKVTDIPPSIHSKTKRPYKEVGEKSFTDKQSVRDLPKLPRDFVEKLKKLFPSKTSNRKSVNGRANKLKSMTSAALSSGRDVKKVSKEVYQFDLDNHEKPYFSDEDEFGIESKKPKTVALRFVKR